MRSWLVLLDSPHDIAPASHETGFWALPKRFPDAIELGNALLRLRLGRGEEALAAYRQPLAYDVVDPLTRTQLEQRIAELERGVDVASLKPLANPWRE